MSALRCNTYPISRSTQSDIKVGLFVMFAAASSSSIGRSISWLRFRPYVQLNLLPCGKCKTETSQARWPQIIVENKKQHPKHKYNPPTAGINSRHWTASTASSAEEAADLEDVVVDLDTDKLFPLDVLPPPARSACVLGESSGLCSPPPLRWELASV